jgi:hypothetical protein
MGCLACKPLRKNKLIGPAMFIALVLSTVSPDAMAQTGGQTQKAQSQSTQSQSSSSNSQNPFNDIVGAINTLVNKSPNASSTDAQNKSGKAASAGAGKQVANKTIADQPDTEDVGKSLADLKDYYERGLITKPEYDAKRKELLAKMH